MPEVGLFAARTPRRPNPLGVGAARLIPRERYDLWGSGNGAWPGTPIHDIKRYGPRDDLGRDATISNRLESLWSAQVAGREQPEWPRNGVQQ